MKVFITKKSGINASGEYNEKTGSLVVKKGSILSESIAHSAKFRGTESIKKSREGVMNGNVLTKDVAFKSPSTAANFVTGASTNGWIAWKNAAGVSIKELFSNKEVK